MSSETSVLVPLTTTGSVDAPSSTGLLPVPVVPVGTVAVVARRLVVLAATAGEEERCDRHEEGADHHLRDNSSLAGGARKDSSPEGLWRRASLGPWHD